MELRVDAGVFRIAQLGPGFMILRPPVVLPPGTGGEVVVCIDGAESRFPVRLDHGSNASQVRTPISAELPISAAATSAA